jgi:hypothetical protein
MSDAVFTGRVVESVFLADDLDRWRRAMRSREGKRTRVTVGPEVRKRSNRQLDYYWASIIRPFAQWSSGDNHPTEKLEAQVHEMLLREVLVPMLPERFLLPTPKGQPIQGTGSTKALSTEEMNEYIARARDLLLNKYEFETPDIDHVSIRR